MIDHKKWTDTLPKNSFNPISENYKLNDEKWIDTIPNKSKNNPIKKYSFVTAFFILGIFFVSIIKNETRGLQKEINNLRTEINSYKLDLHNATLDYEVLTSPENISLLAKEYLESELTTYEKSQIKSLNEINDLESKKNKEIFKEKTKDMTDAVKAKMVKKIEEKKAQISKLQKLYSDPKNAPAEVKSSLAQKIEKSKTELKNLYENPGDAATVSKIQKWAGIQVVKVFLGIPVVPGK